MILSNIITLVFLFSCLAWYGFKYLELVIELEERSIDLDIPMWIPYLAIPISFAFSGFRVAQKLTYLITTPADKIVRKSEATMILEVDGDNKEIKKGGLQ